MSPSNELPGARAVREPRNVPSTSSAAASAISNRAPPPKGVPPPLKLKEISYPPTPPKVMRRVELQATALQSALSTRM